MSEERLEEQAFASVVADLEQGAKQPEIVARLVASGWSPSHAARFVSGVAAARTMGAASGGDAAAYAPAAVEEAEGDPALRDFAIGGLFLAIGVGVTVWTYSLAAQSRGGGTYVVAYGPIVYGAFRLFRGFVRSGT